MGLFDGENYNGEFTSQSNKKTLQNSTGGVTDNSLFDRLSLRTTIYTYDSPVNSNDFKHAIQNSITQNASLPAPYLNPNILNRTSLPSAVEVASGTSGTGSAMQFFDGDGTPYGCGYYRTLGFNISNYQANNNAYGLGTSNNGNPKWQVLSAEKRDPGLGLGNGGGAPDANSEWSWPKMYLSIDEYDSLSDSWVNCKSLFQIHKDYHDVQLSTSGNVQVQLDDALGNIGLSSHKEEYTSTGLVPLFVTIEPSAYQKPSNSPPYTGPLNGDDYGYGLGQGANKYSSTFTDVIESGNPMMRGTIAVPFGDAQDGASERTFRYRVHLVNERFFQHIQISSELANNPGTYPSFTDSNAEFINIDEMRSLLEYACDTNFTASINSEITFSTSTSGPIPALANNCVPEVSGDTEGCMDSSADNYDPDATITNCECEYCGTDQWFLGNWVPSFNQEGSYINNNGTCNPSLGFTNISNAMQVFGAQVTGGQSLPDGLYSSLTPTNSVTSALYNPSTGLTSQSQFDHNNWIQIDNAQNNICNGTVSVPIYVACYNTTTQQFIPTNENLYADGFVSVATNNIYNNVWLVEPGDTYEYVYITEYNPNLCSDCDTPANASLCYSVSQTITPQPCDETPSEISVCMCEDCDEHFAITKADCLGNDISSYLEEFGINWEGFVQGDENCPCGDDEITIPPCRLEGEWTYLNYVDSESYSSDAKISLVGYNSLQQFENENGIVAFNIFNGNNNINSGTYLNNQSEIEIVGGTTLLTGSETILPSNLFIYEFSNLPSGNITIQTNTLVSTPDGYVIVCTDEQTIYIESPVLCTNASTEFRANGEDVSCIGSSDGVGFINQTGNSAQGPYTITVLNSDGVIIDLIEDSSDVDSLQFNDLAIGDYSVIVTDSNDCVYTTSFTIGQPTPIVFSVLTTNVTSFGGNDGTATVNNITGGAGNYITEWTDEEGASVNNYSLAAGQYTVTITDANGCFVTTTVTLSEASCDLNVSGEVVNPGDGLSDGSINLSFSGGLAPYTIDWVGPNDFEASTSTISNLDVGVYSVQICSNSDFSSSNEPCCAYATFTLINSKGECLTEDNEKLILDKVNEILSSCDCVLPEIPNTDNR
jgi:hypothetical protein